MNADQLKNTIEDAAGSIAYYRRELEREMARLEAATMALLELDAEEGDAIADDIMWRASGRTVGIADVLDWAEARA